MANWASVWHYRLDTPQRPPRPVFQADPTTGSGGSGLGEAILSPDKTLLIAQAAARVHFGYSTLMAWDIATGAQVYSVSGGLLWALSPDGAYLVSVDGNEWIADIWQARTGEKIASTRLNQDESADAFSKRGNLRKIVFSPDGQVIAISSLFYEINSSYGQLRLLEIPSGKKLAVYTLEVHPLPFVGAGYDAAVTFSPDGHTVTYDGHTWEVPRD
jgi:WD40 repeat protein